jgi:hypothetical protein
VNTRSNRCSGTQGPACRQRDATDVDGVPACAQQGNGHSTDPMREVGDSLRASQTRFDDADLSPQSVSLYSTWRTVGRPAELHGCEKGGHGFAAHEAARWPAELFRYGPCQRCIGALKGALRPPTTRRRHHVQLQRDPRALRHQHQ